MKTLIVNGSPVNNRATAELVNIISNCLSDKSEIKTLCLGDLEIKFCIGCKTCYETLTCFQTDDVEYLLDEISKCDSIVFVVPSYWADVPGQLKTFFDRCTPYSNSSPNPLHKEILKGKKGYAVALRTGTNPTECQHIIDSIKHFYGHMEIQMCNSFYLCQIKNIDDIVTRNEDIIKQCKQWII